MIYIILYAFALGLSLYLWKKKHFDFLLRLYKCKTYKNEIYILHIERSIENHQQIYDAVMNQVIKIGGCLVRRQLETHLFFKKLRKCNIYILEGLSFYYPSGALDNNGTRYYNLKGVYSRSRNRIVLTEDYAALTWELKNLYNYVSGDRTQLDPAPSDIGLEGCI